MSRRPRCRGRRRYLAFSAWSWSSPFLSQCVFREWGQSGAGARTLVSRPPAARGRPLPRAKRSIKGVRVLVTDEGRQLVDLDRRLPQVGARELPPRLGKQFPERRSFLGDPALEGTAAGAALS